MDYKHCHSLLHPSIPNAWSLRHIKINSNHPKSHLMVSITGINAHNAMDWNDDKTWNEIKRNEYVAVQWPNDSIPFGSPSPSTNEATKSPKRTVSTYHNALKHSMNRVRAWSISSDYSLHVLPCQWANETSCVRAQSHTALVHQLMDH